MVPYFGQNSLLCPLIALLYMAPYDRLHVQFENKGQQQGISKQEDKDRLLGNTCQVGGQFDDFFG